MSHDWSYEEVEAIVADYFAMFEKDLAGLGYNKAEHNRAIRVLIPKRNRSAVEQKHRNISAVLWHLGYPYLRGYKPLPRYQRLLREVVEERLNSSKVLNQLVSKSVRAQVTSAPRLSNFRAIQVSPPSRKEVTELVKDESQRKTTFVRRNYLEEEAKNHSLGLAGEEFILRFEHERLWRAGKRALANQVEHVAKTRGDFLGFDILSFENNGCERLIEVKTTRFDALTRFFASSNEVEFSETRKSEFHLYRLFNFNKQPKFFVLKGALRDTCQLKAVSYSAVPN
jgi:hypothetical protein